MSARQLALVHRLGCTPCEEMLEELAALGMRRPLPRVEVLDVDADRELKKRYGLEVPVLLLDGAVVCRHRLDVAELERRLDGAGARV